MTQEEKMALLQGMFAGADLNGVRQIIGVNEGEVCYHKDCKGGGEAGDGAQKAVTVKVRAKVLLELMKRCGMGLDTRDRTKVCRLAAILMGCDYKALLNTVSDGIRLNERTHSDEVKQVNALLKDLETDYRLDF